MDKDARIAALEARVVELERLLAAALEQIARLSKNSRTSSKPPSSDIVKPPPESPGERSKGGGGAGGGSKRKIGGQPGHDKHAHVAFPADRIDAAWVYDWADAGDGWEAMDEFYILQQVELRENPLIVTEHRFRRYRHRVSGRVVTAPVPEALRRHGLIGPRLRAATALLKGQCHVSYRPMQTLYRDVLGLKLSTGQLAKIVRQCGQSLAGPHADLCAKLPGQPVVNVDETGHREQRLRGRGQRGWLWCAAAKSFTVFKVTSSRAAAVLEDLLGLDYAGVVCSDFYSAYRKFIADGRARAAYCWAHLVRDIRYLTTLSDKVTLNWANKLLAEVKRLFRSYHGQDARGRQRARDAIVKRMRHPPPRREAQTLAERVAAHAEAYFRFLDDPSIEPTNNAAERALRHAVIDRRITQGTRGDAGSRWLERFLSIRETCRQQNRPLFDYLVQAITQHAAGQPVGRLV
jgi:transposase